MSIISLQQTENFFCEKSWFPATLSCGSIDNFAKSRPSLNRLSFLLSKPFFQLVMSGFHHGKMAVAEQSF